MFYDAYIIFPHICRASRFHGGAEVQSKRGEELLDSLYQTWIAVHGSMEYWYIDGESGINTERILNALARDGIIV